MGDSEVKLRRRSKSMPDDAFFDAWIGWEVMSDGAKSVGFA
jgi:hypothetical protein